MNIKALTYRLWGYKTVDELFDEVKKGKTASGKAMDNARKLSKALMPTGLFYQKGGEVFEATQDVQISYFTSSRSSERDPANYSPYARTYAEHRAGASVCST